MNLKDTIKKQKHAGKKFDGKSVWHTNNDGTYWSGWMPNGVSPEELYYVCVTTITDLQINNPELTEKITKMLANQ